MKRNYRNEERGKRGAREEKEGRVKVKDETQDGEEEDCYRCGVKGRVALMKEREKVTDRQRQRLKS